MCRKEKRLALLLISVLLILLCIGAGSLIAGESSVVEDAPTAKVTGLSGDVVARKGAMGDYLQLSLGQLLTADYTIKTAKGARLELTLPDKSILRIAPFSVIKLKSLIKTGSKKKGSNKFKITAGKIWANVSEAVGTDHNFEVSTDSAVAGVRGTVFRVDLMDDKATVVKVYSGAVAVSNSPIFTQKAEKQGERVEIPGPKEVNKKTWEELVANAMTEVRVAADGVMKLTRFTVLSDKDDEWVKWNLERDKKSGIKHKK